MLGHQEAIDIVKRSVGCLFAILFHTTYGDSEVVVGEEGTVGRIFFRVSEKWLEANRCSNFDMTPEKLILAWGIIKECSCLECKEVQHRMTEIEKLCCNAGFSPEKMWHNKTQEEMAFFFRWFSGDESHFWVWPEEK